MTNESEQAQAIQRWNHSNYEEMTLYDDGTWVMYDDHKAIVDSQAQKIVEQAEEIDGLRLTKHTEDELRKQFENKQRCDAQDFGGYSGAYLIRNENGSYKSSVTEHTFTGWLECAKYLGVLE